MKKPIVYPDFDRMGGLVPAVIQDYQSSEVLMLAYMNEEAYMLTIKTKFVHFWSRSRSKLWLKGEESGNKLLVKSITIDCDSDALLVKVRLLGTNVCHTGNKTCFFNTIL